MYYSKTTGGFYDDPAAYIAAGTWPADAVEITDELYNQVARNRPPGKIVVADANGLPMLADPPAPTLDELKAAKNAEARAYLASTDWYVIRKTETGVEIPADILAARQAARESVA